MAGELFRPIFVPDEFREAVSGRAWLRAMLDAEGALASAQARAGLIPRQAAEIIVSCCDPDRFDPEEIGRNGRAKGNPVPPLVRALTAAVSKVSEDAAKHVHKGATSQDIMDTAAMLVSRHALGLILTEVVGIAAACARLADTYRDAMMPGRTLLQQALPTTFGRKAAGWLVSMLEARDRMFAARESGLAVQLGGAAGTLASLGPAGTRVLAEFARELDLVEPVVPWHTDRVRISEIGGALSLVAGVLGKISQDVILMAQTEVGEVAEPAGEGRGGSSTLPHKRNPILSVTAVANVRRVLDLAHTLQAAMLGEHERAAGAWHSEWEALSDALALAGGAATAVREVTEGLVVYPQQDAGEPERHRRPATRRERNHGCGAASRAPGGARPRRANLASGPRKRKASTRRTVVRTPTPGGSVRGGDRRGARPGGLPRVCRGVRGPGSCNSIVRRRSSDPRSYSGTEPRSRRA